MERQWYACICLLAGLRLCRALGSCPQEQPDFLHLTLCLKSEPRRIALFGKDRWRVREREMKHQQEWSCYRLTDIYAVRHEETGPYRANPVANRVHKDKK